MGRGSGGGCRLGGPSKPRVAPPPVLPRCFSLRCWRRSCCTAEADLAPISPALYSTTPKVPLPPQRTEFRETEKRVTGKPQGETKHYQPALVLTVVGLAHSERLNGMGVGCTHAASRSRCRRTDHRPCGPHRARSARAHAPPPTVSRPDSCASWLLLDGRAAPFSRPYR